MDKDTLSAVIGDIAKNADVYLGSALSVLETTIKGFRTPPQELVKAPRQNPGASIESLVHRMQLEATKIALGTYSSSIRADARRIDGQSQPDAAVLECLLLVSSIPPILLDAYVATLKDPLKKELRYATTVVVQERAKKGENLCQSFYSMLSEIREEGFIAGDRDPEEMLRKSLENLSLNKYVKSDRYRWPAVVITSCIEWREFEQSLVSDSNNSGVSAVLKIVADDLNLCKKIVLDTKRELNEFVEDPSSVEADLGDDSDDEEREEQEADETGIEERVGRAKLWINKVNLISILYTSLLRRRLIKETYDELVSQDAKAGEEKFVDFLNLITKHAELIGVEIDEVAGGIMEGEAADDLHAHEERLKELLTKVADHASSVANDSYCKWYLAWKEKFLEGLT